MKDIGVRAPKAAGKIYRRESAESNIQIWRDINEKE